MNGMKLEIESSGDTKAGDRFVTIACMVYGVAIKIAVRGQMWS